ncbi:hypothetical protein [Companilactobacillus kimchiensis]|uniref:Uncharacterized protein n=1 Tax=Companilactobacillus kimchiensis TaxID=993692 RepID=A0A0R2LL93_9LACO|nr:hypothetical protein [Companilactobacillus kimchiensis]KRN98948.1 hypothetical protein IV57_GL000651 [Companilactobacillus kimchiensis]
MNQQKKLETLEQINSLLGKMNQSVADSMAVKNQIQIAYNKINQPEKDSQKYKQISDAISEMNYQFQQMALKKQYHFTVQQNEYINELNKLSEKSMLQSGIGTINGIVGH